MWCFGRHMGTHVLGLVQEVLLQVHIRGGKIGEAPLHIASRIDEAKGEQCSK